MRLPRDLSGDDLIQGLQGLGYKPTRQTGSHVRLTRETPEGSHHVTIPRHKALRLRAEGDDWEVRLEPPVNRVLPVARGELARLEAAFGEGYGTTA